jgi:hypothetical protein
VKDALCGEIVTLFEPADIPGAIDKVLSQPEVYTKENCLKSVEEYTPQKVIGPSV